MDSAMDLACLQARLHELERDLQTMMATNEALRLENQELVKERDNIFYKWTKEDFMDMVDLHLDEYIPDDIEAFKERFWNIWIVEFNERWSSHECHESMMEIIKELAEENNDLLHASADNIPFKPKKE